MKNVSNIRDKSSSKDSEYQNSFQLKSLDEFLDYELSKEKEIIEELGRFKQSVYKKLEKEDFERNKRAIEDLLNFKRTLEQFGSSFNYEQENAYLKRVQQEQFKSERNKALEYWKSYGPEERRKEARENKKLDKEIGHYKKIAEGRIKVSNYDEQIQAQSEKIERAKHDKRINLVKAEEKLSELKAKRKEVSSVLQKEETSLVMSDEFKEGFSEVFSEFGQQLNSGFSGTLIGTLVDNLTNTMKGIGKAIGEGLNQINSTVSKYAEYQTSINTRLQGSREDTIEIFGSIEDNLRKVAFSPLLSAEDLYANVGSMVAEGIAFNVEQRAFLQTIKDGIATTFDANSEALKRIIRLQQYDSTASRLGMEAYLTSFLNSLTKNTEYLQSTFDNVAESLLEASALMRPSESTEFEYVVQKWLGTLTSLGLSETTATGMASALGYLGSGNISALSSSNLQNLLVMAITKAGQNYSDMLSEGLTPALVNQIMYSTVTYMAELGKSSSNVVKSQLASTFGVSVSDLIAAQNIVQENNSIITNLYDDMLTYNNMYTELGRQMGTLREREGISNILENLFSNFVFSTGMGIASNPITYATWKITDLIQNVTGGINIPYITALGTGIDLETTVENLMKLAIVGVEAVGSGIGDIVSGINSIKGDNAENLLTLLGIGPRSERNVLVRGEGFRSRSTGDVGVSLSTLQSTIEANMLGSDYTESALFAAEDLQQERLDTQKSEKTSFDELNDYMQGPQQRMYEDVRKNVSLLQQQVSTGVNVKLVDKPIVVIEDSSKDKSQVDINEKTSIDELNEYIQGPQQELYEDVRKNVNELQKQVSEGITVRLSVDDIARLTLANNTNNMNY